MEEAREKGVEDDTADKRATAAQVRLKVILGNFFRFAYFKVILSYFLVVPEPSLNFGSGSTQKLRLRNTGSRHALVKPCK